MASTPNRRPEILPPARPLPGSVCECAQGIFDDITVTNPLARAELAAPLSPDTILQDMLDLDSLTFGSVRGTEAQALSLWTATQGAADRMSRDRLASFIERVEDDASLKEFVLLHEGDVGPRDDGKPSENEAELRIRLSHYAGTAIKQLAQLLKLKAALAADRELSQPECGMLHPHVCPSSWG